MIIYENITLLFLIKKIITVIQDSFRIILKMAEQQPTEPKMHIEDALDHASKMLPDANGMLV